MRRYLTIVQIFLLAGLVICIILLSLVPPVSRDALIHHLTLPKLYLKYGIMHEFPFMFFSYFPMNVTLLYMIPLAAGNDIAPKFIHFSFALLTACMIYRYLKRRIGAGYALFGVLLFLSVPVIIRLSITAYVDLGLTCFAFASLLFIFRWADDDFRFRYLAISAIFCGLSLGTKYSGLVVLFVLSAIVPLIYLRCKKAEARLSVLFRNTIGFVSISLLCFSPWMARNYIWKENPVYPLFDHHLHPGRYDFSHKPDSPFEAFRAMPERKVNHFVYRYLEYKEPTWYILLLPLRLFFQGKDFVPHDFDGKLSPALLILPCFAFFRTSKSDTCIRREKSILLAFSVLFFMIVFFTTSLRVRYFTPMIPGLVLLCAFGLKNIFQLFTTISSVSHRNICAGAVIGMLLFFAVIPIRYLIEQFYYVKPFDYLPGKQSRDDYISSLRPEYPAIRYINEHTSADSKIFFLFIGNRTYYCDREFIFEARNYEGNTLRLLLEGSENSVQMLTALKEKQISHIFLNYPMFLKWSNESLRPGTQKRLSYFFRRHCKEVFSENGYDIWELTH